MSILDSFRLDGRTALVTGGGRGLGRAGAEALAAAGAHVVVVGRTPEPLDEAVAAITGAGGSATSRIVDVASEDGIVSLFAWLDDTVGGLDILVNNAAIADEARVADVTADAWDRVAEVNSRAPFLTTRELVRRDVDAPRSVINISSLAGSVGVKNQAAYSASKGAVSSLTRALAVELAPRGIRVNAIAPGYFRTDMPADVIADDRARESLLRRVPQRRIPEPGEIGPTIVYLASQASAFLTGAIIHLDGGYTAQ